MPILRGSASGNLQSNRDNGLPLSTVYYSGSNGWAQRFLLRIFELLIKSVINRPRASAFPPDTLQCFKPKMKPPSPVCECCKRAQLSCLVLNIFRYTDAVMGSGLFYDLHMRNKNRCSLRHKTLSYWLCRVALFSPPTPPRHPSSLFTNVAVIYSHSIYYCCTLQEGESWPFSPRVKPYCKAHILKISICWRGRRAATDLRDQRVHTAPQRSRTATAGGSTRKTRWMHRIVSSRNSDAEGTVCTELY